MNTSKRSQYTLEYKKEAVRLVNAGQSTTAVGKILNVPHKTLQTWVKQERSGQLNGANSKPVSAEQMVLARLRAENSRLRMERDILKKAAAYFAQESK